MSQDNQKAKRYCAIKYSLAIIDTVYILVLLFLFLKLGLSKILAILSLPAYLLVISLLYYLLDFPFTLYHSFILEHKFGLSTQKFSAWIFDQLKAGIIAYSISLILLEVFYYILKHNPFTWWIMVCLFWIFFSIILAKLTPLIIIPLFFKYKKISDEVLRQRILNLAQRLKVKILDVFEIDFSKKTLKANAGFVGIGNTKRVILADTLKDKYSHDEIEVILAHEFAHYKLRHLFKIILLNSSATIVAFYLIFKTSAYFLGWFGLSGLSDIAALPLIAIYFIACGIILQPLENYFSRRWEREADKLALKVTGLKEAFISMMNKLSLQNLTDRNPHPLIKIFFFDHPPVDERIALADSFVRSAAINKLKT